MSVKCEVKTSPPSTLPTVFQQTQRSDDYISPVGVNILVIWYDLA